jgi:hypothetical protein
MDNFVTKMQESRSRGQPKEEVVESDGGQLSFFLNINFGSLNKFQ